MFKRFTACLLLVVFSIFAGEPLRLWIFSDTQPGNAGGWKHGTTNSPLDALDKMMSMAKKTGCDALLGVGDISDSNNPAVYDEHWAVYQHYFGKESNPPQWLVVMGNHDYSYYPKDEKGNVTGSRKWYPNSKGQTEQLEEIFREHLHLKSIHHHVIIKGIDIIGVSLEGGLTPNQQNREYLEAELKKAAARDSQKPIIVFAHNYVPGTIAGWGNANSIGEILKKYPQVVYFSGHTHYPLESERAIHQRDFTSVATSNMCYVYMDEVPSLDYGGRSLGKNALYVTIDDQKMVIRRYQMRDQTEIFPDRPWIIDIPVRRETFRYTDEKRPVAKRTAPKFPKGSTLKATPVMSNGELTAVKLVGTAAKHEEFTDCYWITIEARDAAGAWKPVKQRQLKGGKFVESDGRIRCFSDFYVGLNFMSPTFTANIPVKPAGGLWVGCGFAPNTTYRFTVHAAETFGKESKNYLQTTLTTPSAVVH